MTEKALNDVWLTGLQNGGVFSDSKTVLLQQTERGNEAGKIFFTRFPDFCEIPLKHRTFLF
jgi:hypothetical protein